MSYTITSLRYPQLELPGGQTIPAIIIPIALSSAFAVWQVYERCIPVRQEAAIAISTKLCVNILMGISCASLMIPSAVYIFLKQVFTSVVAFSLDNTVITSITFRTEFESRIQASGAGGAATLMLLLIWLDSPPPWPKSTALAIGSIALLSWWPSRDSGEDSEPMLGIQGTLLIILLLSAQIPGHMDEHTDFHPPTRLEMFCLMAPLVLWLLWQASIIWLGIRPDTNPETKDKPLRIKILFSSIFTGAWMFGAVITIFLNEYASRFAGFATSCIGVQWLKLRDPVSPPSFSQNNLGSTLYLFLSICFFLCREKNDFWIFVYNIIDSIGWSITSMLSIGFLLIFVDRFGPGLPSMD